MTCAAEARLAVEGSPEAFLVTIELDTFEDGAPFLSRRWEELITRDLL